MPHWKSMMDRDFIFAFDLNGEEATVTITRVEAGTLNGGGGRKAKKPVVYFEGKDKGLALNSTNCKTIAKLYGNYTEKWIGKQVTIYPTTTEMAGETVECIRIRPQRPEAQRNGQNNARRFSKDEVEAARHAAAESLIASLAECDDMETFESLEEARKREWSVLSKDDKLRVKAAVEAALVRINAAQSASAPDAAEQAEIAAQEAQQS